MQSLFTQIAGICRQNLSNFCVSKKTDGRYGLKELPDKNDKSHWNAWIFSRLTLVACPIM